MFKRLSLLGIIALVSVGWCDQALAGVVPGYDFVPGEVIVKFKDGVDAIQKVAVFDDLQGAKMTDYRFNAAEHWKVAGYSVEEAVAKLEADPRVDYAQPNYVLYALEIPNDTRFPDLWGMNNTGQTGGTPDADIDAVEAWDVFTGSSDVLVAVIDSGVDYNHPDLATNIWTNPGEIPGNSIDDDNNGFVDDIHGWDFINNDADPMDDNDHGTHCSGTIGGVGNNATGVVGVSWDVSIMALKFLSSGGTGSTADAIGCIDYATAAGVDIMSNSWGGGPFDTAMQSAIAAADAAGIFFVAAAGNSGSDNDVNPHYPSSYEVPNVVAVMATNHFDERVVEPGWWTSSIGATSVDIAAPGLHIWSTTRNNTYSDFSGTSMATPHVAGALALLRGRFPNISVADGKNLLLTVGNDVLPQLNGMCVSGARLNALKLIADPDTIPPSAVSDLAIATIASNWIELEWSAPGDDGPVGTTSSYDVRYAATAIVDEAGWAAATEAVGEPDPAVFGTLETMRVDGLAVSTTYYFAVRAKDEYGNLGDISNSPSGTTLAAPTVGVLPASLSASLETGGTETQILTVSNVGDGVLDFSIPAAEYIIPVKAGFAAVPQHEYVYVAKGEIDTRPGIAALKGAGGPDTYGYNWRDSDEVGGPVFNWIEINAVGTAVILTDDDNEGPFPIGFPFNYYGTDFTDFQLCSNGFISFSSTSTTVSNQPLPSAGAPSDQLAIFWDDLNPATSGNVYYHNDGTRLIVEWDAVPHFDLGGVYTMQVHLYPNGIIEYHYKTMTTPVNSATVGIQNSDGTDGLTVVYNAAYLHDNLAVRFAAISPWLATSPSSGSVAAGASVDVDVMFDASGLCGSHFDANLHVLTNDPVTPDVVVPVGLDLTGTPDIQLTALSMDFGSVYITADTALDLTVVNAGCADLTVSGLDITGPEAVDFSITQTVPFTLLAGASQVVPVTFAPSAPGARAATLTVTSDDGDSPTIDVTLSGTGLDFPDIVVAPTSLEETLATGGTSSQLLTITNNGLGDLNFTIPEAEYITTGEAKVAPLPGSEPIELAKGEADPRVGAPVILGTGGPDAFGYRWTDSDEIGGPAYNWIEIDAIGTPIPLSSDDANLGPYPIGFSFPFYGNTFTEFRACSNGWVSFTSTATGFSNYALPSTSAPENLLAVFHDDLTFSTSGAAYYHYDGTRLIIEYKDVPRLSSGGPYTFQIHLYSNGRIEYHYQSMLGTRLDEATIGIQNATKDDGLTVVFNANYVHDNLAIRFQALPPWLSPAPNSGTVLPGASLDVTIGFDAADLCGDQYLANLHILSNDPDTPDAVVPVTLILTGEPDAQLAPLALDFGSVYLTQNAVLPVGLANAGCASLQVTDITFDNAEFSVDAVAPFTVAVGSTMPLNVTYTPAAAGAAVGVMTVTTDDPDTPVWTVDLAGAGLDLAQITVTPTDMTQIVHINSSRTADLHIENSGAGELSWTIPSPDLYNKTVAAVKKATPAPAFVEGPKDAVTKELDVGSLGIGGPDAYGYRWIDSDEAGGPMFSWIDISATGTPALTTGDDSNVGPFPIGFTLKFYDGQFDNFRVCSNGFMSFTSTLTAYTNQALPYASGPFDLIAPFWDDLNLSNVASGDVYYENVDGNLVVMWDNVMPYASGAGPYSFEVIITPTGKITLQYLNVGSPSSCTVGIQDATGTVGLNVVYNAAYLHDNMAIQISALPEWASVTPTSGVLPSGGATDVSVTFDATGMDLGLHDGMIRVMSNDVANPEVQVPITMDVQDLSAVGDEIPAQLALLQNVPNPFNPVTTIKLALPTKGQVDLKVYDVRGALIRNLVSREMEAGLHDVVWDGRGERGERVPSGVYFYQMKADGAEFTRRMALVK